jgi:hypothetical protein
MITKALTIDHFLLQSFICREYWYGVVSGAVGGIVLYELISLSCGM